MEVYVYAVELTFFYPEIFIQVRSEHPPMQHRPFGSNVTESGIQHAIASNTVRAGIYIAVCTFAILFPRYQSDIFQGHVIDPIEIVETISRIVCDILLPGLQTDPLITDNRSTAGNGKTILEI